MTKREAKALIMSKAREAGACPDGIRRFRQGRAEGMDAEWFIGFVLGIRWHELTIAERQEIDEYPWVMTFQEEMQSWPRDKIMAAIERVFGGAK